MDSAVTPNKPAAATAATATTATTATAAKNGKPVATVTTEDATTVKKPKSVAFAINAPTSPPISPISVSKTVNLSTIPEPKEPEPELGSKPQALKTKKPTIPASEPEIKTAVIGMLKAAEAQLNMLVTICKNAPNINMDADVQKAKTSLCCILNPPNGSDAENADAKKNKSEEEKKAEDEDEDEDEDTDTKDALLAKAVQAAQTAANNKNRYIDDKDESKAQAVTINITDDTFRTEPAVLQVFKEGIPESARNNWDVIIQTDNTILYRNKKTGREQYILPAPERIPTNAEKEAALPAPTKDQKDQAIAETATLIGPQLPEGIQSLDINDEGDVLFILANGAAVTDPTTVDPPLNPPPAPERIQAIKDNIKATLVRLKVKSGTAAAEPVTDAAEQLKTAAVAAKAQVKAAPSGNAAATVAAGEPVKAYLASKGFTETQQNELLPIFLGLPDNWDIVRHEISGPGQEYRYFTNAENNTTWDLPRADETTADQVRARVDAAEAAEAAQLLNAAVTARTQIRDAGNSVTREAATAAATAPVKAYLAGKNFTEDQQNELLPVFLNMPDGWTIYRNTDPQPGQPTPNYRYFVDSSNNSTWNEPMQGETTVSRRIPEPEPEPGAGAGAGAGAAASATTGAAELPEPNSAQKAAAIAAVGPLPAEISRILIDNVGDVYYQLPDGNTTWDPPISAEEIARIKAAVRENLRAAGVQSGRIAGGRRKKRTLRKSKNKRSPRSKKHVSK